MEEGAKVVLISRSPCDDTLKQIAAIEGFTGAPEDVALWVKGDISDEASCNAVAAASVARFGPHIDVLVNNAALFVFKSVEDATGESYCTESFSMWRRPPSHAFLLLQRRTGTAVPA